MLLMDVGVLVYAHREDAVEHGRYREWLESGCEWVTTDRDYTRFPGLRWRHPLAPPPAR